jgi:hypothetical protein
VRSAGLSTTEGVARVAGGSSASPKLWTIVGVWEDAALVRAEPFEAIELSLAELWPDEGPTPPPPDAGRASRRTLPRFRQGMVR